MNRMRQRAALATLVGLLLPGVLAATTNEPAAATEKLGDKSAGDPEAIQAMIAGLKDSDREVSYQCAFFLGKHRIAEARGPLESCLEEESTDPKTRHAAVKSLAELGDAGVMPLLYNGLGSDDPYERYLSNIGLKALCGRDLTDFGYEGPWEGAFVSGPAVYRFRGKPVEKARKRMERWKAIVLMLEWLQQDQPRLFKELNNLP